MARTKKTPKQVDLVQQGQKARTYQGNRDMREARIRKYTTAKDKWELLNPGQSYPLPAPAPNPLTRRPGVASSK